MIKAKSKSLLQEPACIPHKFQNKKNDEKFIETFALLARSLACDSYTNGKRKPSSI